MNCYSNYKALGEGAAEKAVVAVNKVAAGDVLKASTRSCGEGESATGPRLPGWPTQLPYGGPLCPSGNLIRETARYRKRVCRIETWG